MTDTKHDQRVLFCCWGCEQNDPESSVHLREAIGVMPDGTWLCEECYQECDNRDHGMEPNDDDDVDFLYPEFDDLPRPPVYPLASFALDLGKASIALREAGHTPAVSE